MPKKPAKQIRLEPDVAKKAATNAKLNSRSVPKEVNHTLRAAYAGASLSLSISSPN